jgi:type I restriction enzyme R subunit
MIGQPNMPLNEADTRAQLIDPQLNKAGWTRSQVTREHYYRTDWAYTAGKIVLRGDRAERLPPKRVDYLLRYTDSLPIAVVEAKEEGKPAVAGLQQAKDYARELGLAFAFAANGHEIIEWDAFTGSTRPCARFPGPEELWRRWQINAGQGEPMPHGTGELRPVYSVEVAQARRRNPLLHPYAPPEATHGKEVRYFQEVAVRAVLQRIMRGQGRILLTMATGTGKTFTALQIVWKLIKSGWLGRTNNGQPARVLFLADRVVLRDQAYNAFSPFAATASDPRLLLDEDARRPSLHREIYFALYQTLWNKDARGTRLFEKFPADFFDLIIIDEAHRSGFGTWREILDTFTGAIHLGMTATPKQEENIDTYAYFCAAEPPVPLDSAHPEMGAYHPPAYAYSLGQGIEDGFLATYKVHRIRTDVDKNGLHIHEAVEKGAEVFVPEDAVLKDAYDTPEFERTVSLPDRTAAMTSHLAQMLRRFGPMQKTMVFCVDMDHAQEVARQLNNEFAGLGFGDDYAVAIVSEEGAAGRRRLAQFQDSDKPLPVVATTAELLSTGVDVPAARNIVFMKTVSSPILFKQIIGRGSRVDPDSGKLWFRIIDYTGATRLLDPQWDKPPDAVKASADERPRAAALTGTVRLAETHDLLVGASIALLIGPNEQVGPILTDDAGRYRFDKLPAGEMKIVASGPKLARRELHVGIEADRETVFDIELKPAGEQADRKIKVTGLEVTIADEATFIIAGMHEPMSLEQYLDYTRSKIAGFVPDWSKLLTIWQDPEQRRVFLEQLEKASIDVDVLSEVLDHPEADQADLLAHLAYGRPLRSRAQRATAFRQREAAWLRSQAAEARAVILALVDKYVLGGLREMTDPAVLRVSPFREMGEARGVLRRFGGDPQRFRAAMTELQRRLYADAA